MQSTTDWTLRREHFCPQDLQRWSNAKVAAQQNHALVKHQIAQEVRCRFGPAAPLRVLEIGVRAGYAALALVTGLEPAVEYVGLDAENGEHGGEGGPYTWWADKLLEHYRATIHIVDTQTLRSLSRFGDFHLIHVDGDHTSKGALHDMFLCWPHLRPGGLMLVDDYDYLQPVRAAADAFAEDVAVEIDYQSSWRGEALFWKPNDG